MLNRLEREDLLAEVITEITQSNTNQTKVVDTIIIDRTSNLSEDAKFGHKLAKNTAEWYRYFNL